MAKSDSGAPGAWTLPIALAVVVGVLQRDWSGVLVGALLGYLLSRVWDLQGRVAQLSQGAPAQPAGAPAQEFPPRLPAAPRAPAPAQAAPAPAPAPSAVAVPAKSAPVTSAPATPRPSPPPAEPGPLDQAWSWVSGGNPLARLGILVLFFGAAFLAKYAAERSLVPIELRFAFIAAGAVTLLLVGWRLRGRSPVYAHLLQGGGIAGMYLTVFAATKLYHLLPAGVALALMVLVAVAAAILAVAQESLPLAVVGTAGGFLAPILMATGSGNHIALFTYYAILNVGVFTVAWFRAWRVLNLVGFVFTFGITGAFRAMALEADQMASTDAFVVVFFLMYVGISILFALRQKPDLRGYVSASLVFGLPVAAFGLHASLVQHLEHALAWSALALGAFYVFLAMVLLRFGRAELRLLAEAFAALGLIFASLAVPLGFDGHTTSAMWAVEGAGLLWLGVRQERRLARAFGALLQLLAGIAFLAGSTGAPGAVPFLHSGYVGTVMLALSGALSAWWLARAAPVLAGYEKAWELLLLLWGLLWWFGGGIEELHDAWPGQRVGATIGLFVGTAGLLRWIGERFGWALARHGALAVLPVGVIAALGVSGAHPVAAGGALGWPLLLAAWFALLRRLDREAASPLARAADAFHAAGVWLLALLLIWELSWFAGEHAEGVWRHLPVGLVPALLLWPLARRAPWPAWPLAAHRFAFRVLACAPLALVAALWVVAVNLGSDGAATPLPYIPLLNPLDVSAAVVLLSLAHWWLALDAPERARFGVPASTLHVAGAALTFLWLNAALVRGLHHVMGTPLDAAGLAHSMLVQAALSIFWGTLGFTAMLLATRRASRGLWLAGGVLMGVVVIKLFLVDTAGSGTLARISAFLVVGALLLVCGYLSPLPPAPREQRA